MKKNSKKQLKSHEIPRRRRRRRNTDESTTRGEAPTG
jgi:hypothetical protein